MATAPAASICASTVTPESVSWLWHPYIALGKITSIEGDPGLGKSWLLLAMAAQLSRGIPFPGCPRGEVANTLVMSAEDGIGDTIVPRLIAVGADLSRIQLFPERVTIKDTKLLKEEFEKYRPKLFIIDPLVSFMGSDMDMHRANHCRAIMSTLAALAGTYECAILILRHITKGGRDHAIYRGIGSIDITAACRSVLLIGPSPMDETERAIVHIKSNLAPLGPSLAYSLADSKFEWKGQVEASASQLLGSEMEEDSDNSLPMVQDAENFLRGSLRDGPVASATLIAEAKQQGISTATLKKAKARLKVVSEKAGGSRGGWTWELPTGS